MEFKLTNNINTSCKHKTSGLGLDVTSTALSLQPLCSLFSNINDTHVPQPHLPVQKMSRPPPPMNRASILGSTTPGSVKTLQGYVTPIGAGGVDLLYRCWEAQHWWGSSHKPVPGAYSLSRCTCRQVETHVSSLTQDTHTHFRNIHLGCIPVVRV